jgi:hypothetical protein
VYENIRSKTYHLIVLFLLCAIILFATYKSYYYLSLLVVPCSYCLINKVTLKKSLVYLMIALVVLLISLFLKE